MLGTQSFPSIVRSTFYIVMHLSERNLSRFRSFSLLFLTHSAHFHGSHGIYDCFTCLKIPFTMTKFILRIENKYLNVYNYFVYNERGPQTVRSITRINKIYVFKSIESTMQQISRNVLVLFSRAWLIIADKFI